MLKTALRLCLALGCVTLTGVARGAPPLPQAPPPDPAPGVSPSVGCVAKGASYREHGPRNHPRIALTFDGGPTGYTRPILRILARFGVSATFFIRGQFVHGHRADVRAERRAGHELANHSFTHPHLPSRSELVRTSRLIRGLTGFDPCLFRAPYGDVNGKLLATARHLGMLTIQWDVDSLDSLGANTATVYGRITHRVRNGSIILMHDGEGKHPATVIALPHVLRSLLHRHFRFVTVSQLLGVRQRLARPPGPAPH